MKRSGIPFGILDGKNEKRYAFVLIHTCVWTLETDWISVRTSKCAAVGSSAALRPRRGSGRAFVEVYRRLGDLSLALFLTNALEENSSDLEGV